MEELGNVPTFSALRTFRTATVGVSIVQRRVEIQGCRTGPKLKGWMSFLKPYFHLAANDVHYRKSVSRGLGQFVLFFPPTPALSLELVAALVVLVKIWKSPYVLRLGL